MPDERSSDEPIPENPGPDYFYPPAETKRRAGWSMSEAIRKVQQRVAMRLMPNYLVIAEAHGVTRGSLKKTFSLWKQGKVVLMKSREEITIVDKKSELEQSLQLFDELEEMLNNSLKILVPRARKYQQKGKPLAYRDMGIPLVLQDMRNLTSLRNLKEQGYMAILDKVKREKQLNARTTEVPSIVQPVSRAEDAQRAREVLERKAREREQASKQENPTPP